MFKWQEESYVSLTKLEITKRTEEGMLEAKVGLKLDLLPQTTAQVVNAEESFLKEIKGATPVNT